MAARQSAVGDRQSEPTLRRPADRDRDRERERDSERKRDGKIRTGISVPVAVPVVVAVAVPVAVVVVVAGTPGDAGGVAADVALRIGAEAGEVFEPLVHGQGRARHGRLEVFRRFGIEADRLQVEILADDDLSGALEAERADRPFGGTQVGIEAAPVLRQRPGAAHVFQHGKVPAELFQNQLEQQERQHPEIGDGEALRGCGALFCPCLQRIGHGREYPRGSGGVGKTPELSPA
jgi:hypothetical protein